jgi:hypothetical protein
MAFAEITLKNPQTGKMKVAPVGYSWTLVFFGPIVPALRGDVLWFFILLGTELVTFGWSGVLFGFFYNKIYIKNLVKKGFKVTSVSTGNLIYISANVGMQLPILEDEFNRNMSNTGY